MQSTAYPFEIVIIILLGFTWIPGIKGCVNEIYIYLLRHCGNKNSLQYGFETSSQLFYKKARLASYYINFSTNVKIAKLILILYFFYFNIRGKLSLIRCDK